MRRTQWGICGIVRGFAPDAPHYGELTINLLIASSRLVDHDAAAAIAHMPFREQVLIPCPELLGIGCARRGSFAPDLRLAAAEDRVADTRNGCSQLLFCDVAPPDVLQVGVAVPASAAAHPLEACVGSESIKTEQQAAAQHVSIERLAGADGTKRVREMERNSVSLRMSSRLVIGQRSTRAAVKAAILDGSGCASSGIREMRALPVLLITILTWALVGRSASTAARAASILARIFATKASVSRG
jgi:hypothetical protein